MKNLALVFMVVFMLLISACAPSTEPVSSPTPVAETETPGAVSSEMPQKIISAPDRLGVLKAEDITYLPNAQYSYDASSLTETLSAAMDNRVQLAENIQAYWSVSAYLGEKFSSKDEHFVLSAGAEENIVQINYTDATGFSVVLYVDDAPLYWMVRNNYPADGNIDPSYEICREIIDNKAREIMERGYSGYEVVSFEPINVFDAGNGKYEVFSFDIAYLTEEPDKAPYAGGAYIDSALRVRNADQFNYLVLRGGDHRFLPYDTFSSSDENALAEIERAFADN